MNLILALTDLGNFLVSLMWAVEKLWQFALVILPFLVWGMYTQLSRQTKLLRGVIDELRRNQGGR